MTLPRILKLKYSKYLPALVLVSSLAACSDGGTGEPGTFGSIGDPDLISNDTGVPGDTNNDGGTVTPPVVTPPKVKVLSVTWSAPSIRENGDPISLAEIAGYQIKYGTKAGNYPNQVDINDPSAVSTQIEGLAAGTYYLVLTTIDSDGRKSSFSPEIVVTM